LDEWCGGDQSLIDYLRRLCGYILTGETREQMLAFIHGPAKAGKTTLIKHIAAVMGDYACNAEMDTFTESKMERHSSELARLRGKRLVYAAETEEGRRWAEARIKKLSGEDRITARNLYENPEEFMPEFKLVIYGNHAPHLRNPDESISRRMHIIPFTHPVSDENRDRQLDEKLRAEHGRILSWMIAGCVEWAEAGLGLPEAVSDAVTRYMDAEDTFGDWVNEKIDRKADGRVTSADLYRSYRSFIESRGESPVSQKRFSPKMEERGFRRIKSMGIRMFEGGLLKVDQNADSHEHRPYMD
jgi:putative DNA primase/helicase